MSQANKPKLKVLYQRLGDTWYAFTAVGDEIFFGKVPVAQGTRAKTGNKNKAKTTRGRAAKKASQAA